ncbi:MAG: hypothetical protein ACYC0M_05295 [Burkholderiales bacterium]
MNFNSKMKISNFFIGVTLLAGEDVAGYRWRPFDVRIDARVASAA